MLPTFIVIGAMKAGTTSLYEQLRRHPQVFMAEPKELDFFVEGKRWALGVEWYESRFDSAGEAVARGEVSPSYSKAEVFPGVPERMAATVPDVRLVYLVRDPVARMQSMYLHEVAAGRETRPVEEALGQDRHYLDSSRYAWQLSAYRPHFPRDRVLVVTLEEMQAGGRGLELVLDHIGVPAPQADPPDVHSGRTADRRALPRRWTALRSHPILAPVASRLPRGVRARIGGTLRRPVDARAAEISPELRRTLEAELATDVAELAGWFGERPFRGWGLLD